MARPGDSLAFAVNAYYADVEDFIDQRVTFIDFGTGVPGPGGLIMGGTTTSENMDARLWGFEADLDYDAERWFAGLGLSIPCGEGEGGAPLGSIPQDRLTARLGFRPAAPWELGARTTLAADRDDVPEDALPGEAFAVTDLFATWRPQAPRLAGAVFRAGIDNVFDETYAIYPNGLNQPGRTLKLAATVTF